MENKKNGRIGYINRSKYDATKMTGTLYWGEEKFKIKNITTNGTTNIGDVARKTGKKYLAKNGVEYDAYEDIGAIRYNSQTGAGDFVMEVAGIPAKYPFTSKVEQSPTGEQTRVLRFREPSENKFRAMFDQAATVIAEEPELPDTATVPF